MIYKNLGHSNIKVSTICLGTMTWGEQNTENEAFQQMDMAFDYGVNFFDTAELYPIPPSEKTQGETSRIISRWIKSKNNRNKIIIADKIVGRSKMDWFRDNADETRLNKKHTNRPRQPSLPSTRAPRPPATPPRQGSGAGGQDSTRNRREGGKFSYSVGSSSCPQ